MRWPVRLRPLLRRLLIGGGLFLLLGAAGLLVLHFACPFPAERITEANRGGSALILDREGGVVAWRVDSLERWRLPVTFERVSPWLIAATVAAEDKRFFSHPGVDAAALARALEQNVSGGRRVSGASTITMQTVRLLEPHPRTYAAKATEALRALQLEQLAGKESILELYFNTAPYGGNTVGAEAASRLYFGKGASDLSLGEAALLAGLPQRPAHFDPRKHLDAALARREYVLARMLEEGLATEREVESARREPIVIRPRFPSTDAGRFADYMVSRLGSDCGQVRSTLSPGLQSLAQKTLEQHFAELESIGVDGLAAVVIDVKSSELVAMVGSARPEDPLTGQVNATTSPRQPGSLLKPFIYARAFDAGVLAPDSVVYDIPTAWRGYSPENIDREFLGPMPAARALAESRNLPAVRLLGRLSTESLAADMTALGIPVDAAVERCGLSLALGTAEVRLLDVANAYAALARMGEWRALRSVAGQSGGESRRVYSEGGAYLLLSCLGVEAVPGQGPCLAWKTGTSWNYRDAWAVAFTPGHVVAVWCGRLSGQGHPGLLGAQSALPVALDLIGKISPREPWPRPKSVSSRELCSVSGAPPSQGCPITRSGLFVAGVSPDLPCRIHRLGAASGSGGVTPETWPPEVAAWLASGRSRDAGGATAAGANAQAVVIVSPASGAEYVVDDSVSGGNMLNLEARTPGDSSGVYWFVDGEFLCFTPPGKRAFCPLVPGGHKAVASDGHAASASVSWSVHGTARARGSGSLAIHPEKPQAKREP